MIIRPSKDRKTKAWPTQYNTFGTLPGSEEGTCPGATYGKGGCCSTPDGRKLQVCYVNRIMSAYPTVRALLTDNTKLKHLTREGMTEAFDTEFFRYYTAEKRQGFIKKNGHCTNWYRIHWSGDIPNTDYAIALANAIKAHKNINFWTYTRTFDALKHFADLPNCIIYVSADADNYEEAIAAYEPYKDNPRVGWCYLSKERVHSEQDLQDCPVDSGKLELDGACHKCRKCFKAKPIWFKQK